MKVTFYAHASFRFEADGTALVTDPYTPGISGFRPIDEAADIVVMSSRTDDFHSDPSHVRGDPVVINALELPPEGVTVRGIPIRGFEAYESRTFDFQTEAGRDPDANALYHFTMGGVRVLHMGDLGNPVDPRQLEVLAGTVDVLLALAGAHATIALDDLDDAIAAIRPRLVIPMHYWHERGVLKIEKVDIFAGRFPPDRVRRPGTASIEVSADTLPAADAMEVTVLEQSR